MDMVAIGVICLSIVGIAYLIDYHLDLDGSYGKENEDTQ